MSRVLVISLGSDGHINPTLGVVQELVRRGEEVVYFTEEKYRNRIEKTGSIVRTIDSNQFLRAYYLEETENQLSRVNALLRTVDIIIPNVLEQIKGQHFDYIIHDFMFGCGRLLSNILEVPAINSCSSFALTKKMYDIMLKMSYGQGSTIYHEKAKEEFQSLTDQVKKNYGIEIDSAFEVFYNPAPLTIVYTTKDFQPNGNLFDDTYKFVGPSIIPRLQNYEFDHSILEGMGVIYISLGTIFNQDIQFYKNCFEAFGDSEETIVMSVGGNIQISDLGHIPKNFIVRDYVPQIQVLQNTKLFITHGGMNSSNEALYYGVPQIVIPQAVDQPLVAKRIFEIGAGIQLKMEEVSAKKLRDAANEIFCNPTFKQVSEQRSKSFKEAGGYFKAVDEIFAFKNQIL